MTLESRLTLRRPSLYPSVACCSRLIIKVTTEPGTIDASRNGFSLFARTSTSVSFVSLSSREHRFLHTRRLAGDVPDTRATSLCPAAWDTCTSTNPGTDDELTTTINRERETEKKRKRRRKRCRKRVAIAVPLPAVRQGRRSIRARYSPARIPRGIVSSATTHAGEAIGFAINGTKHGNDARRASSATMR